MAEYTGQLKPFGEDHDLFRLLRGKDVDITDAHSALTSLADADIFLVDDNAQGNLTTTKKIAASDIKTYMQTGLITTSSSDTLTNKSIDSANNTITNIVNVDIKSDAAIATSKLSGAVTSIGSHGLATSATTDTTNASNISSGTLAAARVATLNQSTTGSSASCTGNAATSTKISSITNSDIVQLTGSQTLTNKGIDSANNTITNIVNADIKSDAAIATTKLSGAVTSIGSHGLGSLATLSTINNSNWDGTALADGNIASASTWNGKQNALIFGIGNTNIPIFTSGVADDDFLRIAGTSVEGRSASEVLGDIEALPLAGGTLTGETIIDRDVTGTSGSFEGLEIDYDSTGNVLGLATLNNRAFDIDLTHSGNNAGTLNNFGLDLAVTQTGSPAGTSNNTGIDLNVTSSGATNSGTINDVGLDIDVVGGTDGTSTAIGIDLDVDGADTNTGLQINTAGTHMKLVANADVNDYATLTLADTGDLTIATIGSGTTDSDITLDADGDIALSASHATQSTIEFQNDANVFFRCQSNEQATKGFFYERGGRYGADDYLTFSVFEHGATTFQTIDAAADNADLQFYADGEVQFRSTKNDFNFKDVDGFTSMAMNTDFQSDAGGFFYFDETGHATGEEDIWYSGSAHGLKVGDRVLSDDSSNGVPTEYSDVENPRDFYVVNVPTTTTMQLSTTLGGSVLAGSADSGSGNSNKWKFKKYNTLIQPIGDVQIDAGGSITLDSAIGDFIFKKNGTEFSVASSAYAGMILGYTTVGIGQTPASFDVTNAMLPVHDDLKVTFKAPPSGVVEIMASIFVDIDSNGKHLTLGLSTTDASTGFTSLDAKYENFTYIGATVGENHQHTHRWIVTGLTPNAIDTYWFAAGCTLTGRIDLRWGGDSSAVADATEPSEYQPFIMKATALPTAVADYAVYG